MKKINFLAYSFAILVIFGGAVMALSKNECCKPTASCCKTLESCCK